MFNEDCCCDPKSFKGMSEMMKKCFSGEGSFDCKAMMETMTDQACCGPETEKASKDRSKKTESSCCL